MEIQEKIIKIIEEILKKDNEENYMKNKVEEDMPLETYGIDSFQFISLIVEIEKSFQIEIPETFLSFEKLDTVSSIVKCVERLLNKDSD